MFGIEGKGDEGRGAGRVLGEAGAALRAATVEHRDRGEHEHRRHGDRAHDGPPPARCRGEGEQPQRSVLPYSESLMVQVFSLFLMFLMSDGQRQGQASPT